MNGSGNNNNNCSPTIGKEHEYIRRGKKKHKGGKFVQWFTLHIKSNTNNQETCGLWIQMSFISLYNLLHVVLSLSLSLSSYSWFSEGCPFDVGLSVAVPEHNQKMELVSIFFMYLSASSVRKSNIFFVVDRIDNRECLKIIPPLSLYLS